MKKMGCGCGTIFGIIFLLVLFDESPLIATLILLALLAIWYFKYLPEQKARKLHAQEIKALEEKEKQLALEKRKLDVKNEELQLKSQHTKLDESEWKCMYCMSINQPEAHECSSCGAKKEKS